jgi:predicted acetyltransferase
MLEMRTVNPDEFFQWVWAEARAYGNRLNIDPEILRPHFDLDRSIAVFDQGNVVGGAHSHKLEMSVPGGQAVVAGVANIAVQPTHTRQGILTRMMHHQINGIHERGEPLAALFASESVIYGRYGYGMSSFREQWTIERQHNRYARPYDTPGRMVFVDPANITNDLPEVFRRSTKDRPGVFQKSGYLWEREKQAPEHRQGGQGGLFYIAYEDGGRIDGYAKYRTSGNTLTVNELMATTPEANSALWRFCFDLDLVTRTEAERRPVDDPMLWMLADPRQLQRITRDGLWLRLVDVAESLELRSYMESGRLVLEVRDDLCSWNQGCFELEASPEGATCRPSTASPDLTVTVAGLASAYLGAASLTKLFQAGLVEERASGALLRADRLFATRLAPWTPCGF